MGEMLIWGSGSITKKLSPIDGHLQRKNQFSTMKSYRVCKQHLRTGPLSSSRWPIQSEHNDVFLDFLSHIALFGHFFIFLFFCLCIIVSYLLSLSLTLSLFGCVWFLVIFCFLHFWFVYFLFVCCFLKREKRHGV